MPTKNTACGSVLSEFIQYEVYPCSSRLIWLQPLPAIFSAALNIWSPKFQKPFKAVGVHRSFIVCLVPCGPNAKRKEVVRFFFWQPIFSPVPREVCPFRNYRVFFWSDDWAVCCDGQQLTKALKRSTICGKNKSPIFLVKFHYICRTNSLPLLYQPVPHLACSYLFLHQRSKQHRTLVDRLIVHFAIRTWIPVNCNERHEDLNLRWESNSSYPSVCWSWFIQKSKTTKKKVDKFASQLLEINL